MLSRRRYNLSCITKYFKEGYASEWVIQDANSIIGGHNQKISSCQFENHSLFNGVFNWRFIYRTVSYDKDPEKHSIDIEIKYDYPNFNSCNMEFKVDTSIIDPMSGKVLFTKNGSSYHVVKPSQKNEPTRIIKNVIESIPRADFLKPGGYFVENTLKLKFVLHIRYLTSGSRSEPESVTGDLLRLKGPFLYKFYHAFKNGEFTDLEIRTSTKTFKCHKFILGAQSPVFSRMLQTKMREGLQSFIKIDDFNAETVEWMLKYLYTGESVMAKDKLNLLKISHKYELKDLKDYCEYELSINVTSENFIDLFLCSELYQLKMMRNRVFQFIRENKTALLKDENFKGLIQTYPGILAQIYLEDIENLKISNT